MKPLSLLLCLLIVGCQKPAPAPAFSVTTNAPAEEWKPCDPAIKDAVLDKLSGRFHEWSAMDVYFDRYKATEGDFQKEQAQIDRLSQWAEGLPNRCFRNAYLDWMDYYQRELNGAREELKSHEQQKEMQEYDQRNESEREAERRVGKIPSPPRMEP